MIEATFATPDPNYAERCRTSFARQGAMTLLGATIEALAPGHCVIELPFRTDLAQQHGYFHAGITSAIADSAGGYAGLTLFPANAEVLTVEFKINLIAPTRTWCAAAERSRSARSTCRARAAANSFPARSCSRR